MRTGALARAAEAEEADVHLRDRGGGALSAHGPRGQTALDVQRRTGSAMPSS